MKKESLSNFVVETGAFNEEQLENFAKIANKLLFETYLVSEKNEDRYYYYLAREHFEALSSYFDLLDFTLHDDQNGVIYLTTQNESGRLELLKLDTVVLLVIRKLDLALLEKATISAGRLIKVKEIYEEINATGIYGSDVRRVVKWSNMLQTLSKLRRFKIIDFATLSGLNEESILTIYPTINIIVKSEDIHSLTLTLSNYTNDTEEATDEETTTD
ncbi:MAG: DUF4194 domain-containing protein [Bacilli bacterium]|nr:DUF4194 domain-containing protein [Bacilli bacterium]